jgi:hypothetical protein
VRNIVALVAALALAACICTPIHHAASPSATRLSVSPLDDDIENLVFHKQDTGFWCWAASGQMIMERLGNNVEQCRQVTDATLNNPDCCSSQGAPVECLHGGEPHFDYYSFDALPENGAGLPPDVIARNINDDQPLAYAWQANNGGDKHMMVVSGYLKQLSSFELHLFDPLQLYDHISYERYIGGPQFATTHLLTFYDIHAHTASAPPIPPPQPFIGRRFVRDIAIRSEDATDIVGRATENVAAAAATEAAVRMLYTALAAHGMTSASGGKPVILDPATLTFGPVIPSYDVQIDDLAVFTGGHALRLLRDRGEIAELIRVGGIMSAAAFINHLNEGWKPTAFTTQMQAQKIAAALQVLASEPAGVTRILVNVPGLETMFLGVFRGADLQLTPVAATPIIHFPVGQIRPASQVFRSLGPAARQFL